MADDDYEDDPAAKDAIDYATQAVFRLATPSVSTILIDAQQRVQAGQIVGYDGTPLGIALHDAAAGERVAVQTHGVAPMRVDAQAYTRTEVVNEPGRQWMFVERSNEPDSPARPAPALVGQRRPRVIVADEADTI